MVIPFLQDMQKQEHSQASRSPNGGGQSRIAYLHRDKVMGRHRDVQVWATPRGNEPRLNEAGALFSLSRHSPDPGSMRSGWSSKSEDAFRKSLNRKKKENVRYVRSVEAFRTAPHVILLFSVNGIGLSRSGPFALLRHVPLQGSGGFQEG